VDPPTDDELIGWPKNAVEQVRVLQQRLLDLKLLRDKPDGVLGPLTRTAIRDAQRGAGLAETGEPSRELFVALTANRRDVVDNSPLPAPPRAEATAQTAPADGEAWPTDRTEQVRTVQKLLRDLELYSGSLTGQLGPVTQAAIREFQRTAGLPQTGEPSRELHLALKSPAPPSSPPPPDPAPAAASDGWPADRTGQLKAIQVLLRELKYYNGGPTGELGPLTQSGIREFQRAAGLPQTGEPSRELYLALRSPPPAPAKPEAAAPPPPADPSPATTGDGWPADRSGQLKAIQVLLRQLNYYSGGPTGELGPLTQAGIRGFQRAAGLPQTGEPSRELYLALKSAPPATAPAEPARPGDPVRAIQTALQGLGFYTDAVDGVAGERTRAAIAEFQRSIGLAETGEPSEALLHSLKSLGKEK
jgi:peptidoglycan hydrolase-like protein with peptidoglycan-binding domain